MCVLGPWALGTGLLGSVDLPGYLIISLNLSFHFCERGHQLGGHRQGSGLIIPRDLLDLPRERIVHPDLQCMASGTSLQRTQGHMTCFGQ